MNLKSKVLLVFLLLWLGLFNSDCIASVASAPNSQQVLHVIDRLSFGPRPGDVERVESIGIERYIQEQLSPDSIPYPADLTNQLNSLETIKLTSEQLLAEYSPPRGMGGQKPSKEEIKACRLRSRIVLAQAVQARLRQNIESPRQLQEVMTDFWYNHFNVYAGKGADRLLVGAYEAEAIRPYALGHFRALLEATAKHPAMLFYLDNWQNTAPGSPGAHGKFQGLNENYAREVMELHTLGVNNGYTQQDVITLARIFTGWTFHRLGQQMTDDTGFYFDPNRHDFSDKVFLGQKIKGSGIEEGEQALDILARSPATARHISYELAQHFVADEPPPDLVEHLTQKFLVTDGDIREVLNTLFHSPEFADPKYYSAKFKTPYQYVVSAIRATGIEVNNFRPVYGMLQQLGMPLYGCLTPDGYKDTQDAWLNPAAMTLRLSFATALADDRLHLNQPDQATIATSTSFTTALASNRQLPFGTMESPQIDNLSHQPVDPLQLASTLGNQFSPETQRAIAESPPQLQAALMLGSPEFMHY
ncbi:MAG: DUF1800 domain-containing protein [Chroococcidiopsidaceae cyanobacterium CP_BM_ER_R8_30]|nr:DUF1800 domain-containing protein [Chroococcidiopsidaceae cyanobacterium CP_BM_ER_R8_30]